MQRYIFPCKVSMPVLENRILVLQLHGSKQNKFRSFFVLRTLLSLWLIELLRLFYMSNNATLVSVNSL